jgi:hypothetical protein
MGIVFQNGVCIGPCSTTGFGSSGFQWMTINSVTDSTASGVGQNGITVAVTQSGGGMGATQGVFNPTAFPEQYGVPFTGNQIQNNNNGTFTATFSQPITDALVAFASIGNGGLYVPIEVSTPFTPIFSTATTFENPLNGTQYTQLTGNEGYAIIRIDGTVTTVTFNYTVAENYCNVCFGFVNQNNLPTPTPTPSAGSSTPTPTPTPTTATLYLNCYTVRQYLFGYNGGGNSDLYVLESDYPNVSTIPVGAIATINGASVSVLSNTQYNSAYFQGGTGYIFDFGQNVGIINAGTTIEFCWYSVNQPTPTPTPTATEVQPTPTPTPTTPPTLYAVSISTVYGDFYSACGGNANITAYSTSNGYPQLGDIYYTTSAGTTTYGAGLYKNNYDAVIELDSLGVMIGGPDSC